MAVDYKQLKKALAENKVYDAMQYIDSLLETLSFMNASYDLLRAVYENRKSVLAQTENELFQQMIVNPGTPVGVTIGHLERTNLSIAGYEVNDTLFIRKTEIEFFHYARLSLDVLIQIVNAALLGDKGFPVTEDSLPKKVLGELKKHPCFKSLHKLLSNGAENAEIRYLIAFDNFTKHIKTILITVRNSFMLGTIDQFEIGSFCYKGTTYPAFSAIDKANSIKTVIIDLVEKTLSAVFLQIPNCLCTHSRYQALKFMQLFDETPDGSKLKYMSFFI